MSDFGMHEWPTATGVCVAVTGELDIASAPILDQRLGELRRDGVPARLDLSALAFIDSSGIAVLINAMTDPAGVDSSLTIEPMVGPMVVRTLQVAGVAGLIAVAQPS